MQFIILAHNPMKTLFLLLAGLLLTGAAQAQTSAADKQALANQLNKLMRNPAKPAEEVRLVFSGCHVQQIIRDRDADVNMAQPVAVSYSKGGSGWAASLADKMLELKFDFDWSEVTSISYAKEEDSRYYQLNLKRHKQNSDNNFSATLYTTNETTVRDLVRRLELVRQSCR